MSDLKKGWECPRCGTIWAPYVMKCKCVRAEESGAKTFRDLGPRKDAVVANPGNVVVRVE